MAASSNIHDDDRKDLQTVKVNAGKSLTKSDADERYYEENRFDDLELCLKYMDFYDREFQEDSRWDPPVCMEQPNSALAWVFVVRVYVFATKYLMDPLRQYCLAYLHEELREFGFFDINSDKVLELLEYTYASTSNQEPTGPSLMRNLVIHYVACRFTILSKIEDFTRILKSNAEIGADLCMTMMRWKFKKAH